MYYYRIVDVGGGWGGGIYTIFNIHNSRDYRYNDRRYHVDDYVYYRNSIWWNFNGFGGIPIYPSDCMALYTGDAIMSVFGEYMRHREFVMPKKDEDPDYINFGDFARNTLGQQCQYASHYVTGIMGYENLGIGLRFKNVDTGDYHDIKIHKDDAEIFEKRYRRHMRDLLE